MKYISSQTNNLSHICKFVVHKVSQRHAFMRVFLHSLLLVLLVSGCADEMPTGTSEIVSVSISPSPLVVSGINTRYQLSLTAQLTSGADTEISSNVTWASSNLSLATVDESGVVVVAAKGLGVISITANYLGVADTIVVEIVDVAELSLSPSVVEATALEQSFLLSTLALDSSNQTINGLSGLVWESTNPLIASVDENGLVTSHAVGETIVTATYTVADAIEKGIGLVGGIDNQLEKTTVVASSKILVNQNATLIQGIAKYEDRLYSASGFRGPSFKAIRFATVELLDENGNLFESTVTNELGEFKFSFSVPDKYSVRLVSEVNANAYTQINSINEQVNMGVSVHDMRGDKYSFSRSSIDNELFYTLTLSRSSFGAGVFNILDIALLSSEYSKQVLNVDVTDLKVFWEQSAGLLGTYYCTAYDAYDCTNDKGIYLISETPSPDNGGVPDTDEFDDDVIMHEFSHFLLENYSVDNSQGGIHYIDQNDSDLRLSWSEGWGAFFPSAVKYWLNSQRPELISSQAAITTYVDTIGENSGLSHDIKLSTPTAKQEPDGFYYASSEAAVARILWNMLEDFGMTKTWDVLTNYFPVVDKPTSLPVFWDGLLASDLYSINDLPALERIFEERRVFFSEDNAETDDSPSTAINQTVGFIPTVANTLYSDTLLADLDYTVFTAAAGQRYKLSTFDLYNGADTLVRLFDENGQLVAENDDLNPNASFSLGANANNTTAMSSGLTFTAAYSGQYFIEVSYANKRSSIFDFVGHYGSYKLAVVEVN